MVITTRTLTTSMGKVNDPFPLDFLTTEQREEFDTIGYTGKNSNGVKMGWVEYLNSLNPKQEKFAMHQIKWDNGNFQEKFILVRVIIAQKIKQTRKCVK